MDDYTSNQFNLFPDDIESTNFPVEREEIDESSLGMEEPFDPTKINIETRTPSLDTLITRMHNNEIQLDTESYFQRKANLWDSIQQSRLIESILIRFPLPAFFFDGSDDNNWLVVDGLQRLSSIDNFVNKKTLRLTKLEFLSKYNGCGWDDLPRDLQRVILESSVVVYKIIKGTPTDVKFNIFKRINTGGLVLNSQEIRHALFQGTPSKFLADLVETQNFKRATGESLPPARMLDREFANRFLAFYIYGYEMSTNFELDRFLTKALNAIDAKNMTDEERSRIFNDFQSSMDLNYLIFNKEAFRKPSERGEARKPINRALFDVLSVLIARLDETKKTILTEKKDAFLSGFYDLCNTDLTFWNSISSSTSDKSRIYYRFNQVGDLIQRTITNSLL